MTNESAVASDEFVPHPSAFRVAAVVVQQIFDKNGNPSSLTLDRAGLEKVVAYAVDCTIKSVDRNWK